MRFQARSCVLAAALTFTAAPAFAQSSPAPSADAQEEARSRFRRALELADDGQFDAALVELRKAYELNPSYRILYNVGVVYQQLKDYARALDALERYLDEGGANIPEDRLADVKGRIERLKGRVAYLEVRSSEPGAEVSVDDLAVGKTPVTRLRVNSGQRRVSVQLPGHPVQTQVIELAGGESRTASFDLRMGAVAAAPPPEPKSIVPWVSWGVTAALAAGAVTTGVLALNKASNYDDLERKFQVDPNALGDARNSARHFALATDILTGAAIVGAGVSIYFTLRPPKPHHTTRVGIYSTGNTAGLRGSF